MGREKILIILASGIGNSILFGPTLKAIRKSMPDAKIDIFAYKKSFAEPFTGSDLIDNVIYFNGIKTIFYLRSQNYDISITAFPSNRWQFNVFAFLIGAKKRITHSYEVGKFLTLSFLQNCKVPADEKLHDVDQNLQLLKFLDISIPRKKEVFFEISNENEKFANDFIKCNGLLGKHIIGIHSGSGPLQFKRAPLDKFLEVINSYSIKKSIVLLFGGDEESEIKEELQKKIKLKTYNINSNLKNVAALIKKCNLFITNDTGLMHIAATSKKTKIIAFFNGTNYVRTRPYSKNSKIIILKENMLKYPFKSTKVEKC